MRRKRLSSLLWSLLLSGWWLPACTAPEDQAPENLVPEDRMANILTEVHLAEARVSRMGLKSVDSSNLVYKHLEAQIFRKFDVDTAAYRKSYIYYSSHPAEMETIYKQVTQQLQKQLDVQRKPHP